MAWYQNFVFSDKPAAQFMPLLAGAARKFSGSAGRPTSVMADDRRLRIQFEPELFAFYAQLCDEGWVVEESQEIARSHPGHAQAAALHNSAWRVEFWADDDENMDYFNDYFGLLELLSAIPGTIIYDYKNSRFFGDK